MDWGFLSFLAEPWFVIPWYAVGIAGMALVIYDEARINTPLKTAMKWGWPIIVLFFSVVGLALYFATARAPRICDKKGAEKKKAHEQYEGNMLRRVNGAVIHCVAGDGIGIMTGMVIARASGMSFWQEFWFEYLVGFLCGWLVFQFKSMTMMTDSKPMALAMAFRAEFFSMLTVMAGMGAVMAYVTPLAVTAQPKPLTYAFWGFGMLGLMVGYVFTFPMNWMMVKIGWKHGMGGMDESNQVKGRGLKIALVATMVVLGFGALLLPAGLFEARRGEPVQGVVAVSQGRPGSRARVQGRRPGPGAAPENGSGLVALAAGLRGTLEAAVSDLEDGSRSAAAHAIDAARRAAEVGKAAASGSAFAEVLEDVMGARHALHMGNEGGARRRLSSAVERLESISAQESPASASPERFAGAIVIDGNGVRIGEVSGVHAGSLELALGGVRDAFGFIDLSARRTVHVPAGDVLFGPSRTIGETLVAVPGTGLGSATASE